ncbi:hypothetical protein MPC1_9990002 [Methylocella tundrae]|nr:hypothetical protein MPC1_9990002 [Methylocella tundrae]
MRKPQFAIAAYLIKSNGDEGPDQRVAGKNGEEQGKCVVARGRGIKQNADHEVNKRQKQEMGRHRAKVIEARSQGMSNIGDSNLSDDRIDGGFGAPRDDVKMCHGRSLRCFIVAFNVSRRLEAMSDSGVRRSSGW